MKTLSIIGAAVAGVAGLALVYATAVVYETASQARARAAERRVAIKSALIDITSKYPAWSGAPQLEKRDTDPQDNS